MPATQVVAQAQNSPPPPTHVGEVRCFGEYGPKYQVERVLRLLDGGETLFEIAFIESGETMEYPLSEVLDDPLAD